ncbi:DMT family transporter [Cupriavidus sp. AU9028]|uniref:DMT family transporter n=1 Tax=Cupriavidus sp. AU9028 TaxID=2871157 RepID=UPI001C9592E4|nr:DMT family transporter [Cupriavidus sp. AU9028]MBY4899118.1 DMT family transporter [Cupriavidus sp. AU9028]
MEEADSDRRAVSPPAKGRASALVAPLTALTMVAFAANSLLARAAFQTTAIDAASFTAIRVTSGALTLLVILLVQGQRLPTARAGPCSALLLFIYAATFSFAYRDISTGAGALVLFAAAQLLMIAYGFLRKGERTSIPGLMLALGGMVAFLGPSASVPSFRAAALMAVAGFAWGGFSLLGRSSESPTASTAASFLWSVPLALLLLLAQSDALRIDAQGVIYALVSGTVTSALGYVIWYWVRVRMTAISAAAVQLSVPVLTAVLGVVLLSEAVTWAGAVASLATLAGVAWVTLTARGRPLKGNDG